MTKNTWQTATLDDLCIVNWGNTSLTKSSYVENGEFLAVSAAGCDGRIDQKEHSKQTPVLSAIGAQCGKMFLPQEDFTAIKNTITLAPKDGITDGRFLYYLLSFITLPQRGAGQPFITKGDVQKFPVKFPPLPEQKRIAEVLDCADALRGKRRLALQKLDTLLQSVFLEMFGDPVINPMGWKVKELGEISTHILNGTTPKGGSEVYVEKGITFFRSQNVWRNRLSLDDIAYIDAETHRQMRKSSLKTNDILITKTGRINTENSSLGRAAMYSGEDDSANINGHVYLVRLEEENIHKFILFILTMDEYREYIRSVCVGGIDKRQINKDHLEKFPIIFPPLDFQRRFATIIELVEHQKTRQQIQLKKLENIFQSFQQKAFKGELFNNELENELTDEKKVWQQTSLS